ncbi:hypothetical protein [Paenibacillus sp. Y412MC10]|uniref:hypothetical protein n=1 Tax=Geobacillus sp. (strain Y412MC10) TaxID=481743 RepID=UPI0011AB5C11|nr:hypothetical protein [Paenibacillus sp. Y412MC10]
MDSNKKIERLKADVPGVFAPVGQWMDADDKVQFIELMNFEYRANIVALLMRLSKDYHYVDIINNAGEKKYIGGALPHILAKMKEFTG